MDILVYIVIGLAILGGVFFFVLRKGPEQLAPGAKKEELGPKPPAKGQVTGTRQADQLPPARRGEPTPLPSSDVLPASDSLPAIAQPKPAPAAPAAAKPTVSRGEVLGIRKGLAATRGGFVARLKDIFVGKKEIDPAILEQIEEIMLTSDVGVKTTGTIVERLRQALQKNELRDEDAVWSALRAEALRVLSVDSGERPLGHGKQKPTIVLMVGVNGVGKTTTIGKLATRHKHEGQKVILGAGDTFRAAAVQQLEVWGKRVDAEVVKGKEGSDPGAVAFEATTKARETGADVVFIDTAGRLHTKAPLMDEIKKVRKSIGKAMEGAPHEILLVLDATTGQNALTQAAMFKEAVELSGIILTKLDGTAKGGIVLGICDELRIPVRYIGLGERAEDLREFSPADFVEALFGRDGDEAAAA